MTSLIVFAKAPRPGWSKTRLSPPLAPDDAAAVAEACLRDTLAAVSRTRGIRPVLALDGPPGPWLPPRIQVIQQRGSGMDERLGAVFTDVGGPAVLIGMDTPQVSPPLLHDAVIRLLQPGVDAVVGPAMDGGWWCLGLREPDPAVFLGVPMSTGITGQLQEERIEALGLTFQRLPWLRDVDEIDDAREVSASIPGSHLAAVMSRLELLEEAVAL
jgi:glycosyltransferase A (GT-A) superfamily protein (DUF2064 family)